MATPTRPCPYCGAAVLMNAPACGTCGRPMPPAQAGGPPPGGAPAKTMFGYAAPVIPQGAGAGGRPAGGPPPPAPAAGQPARPPGPGFGQPPGPPGGFAPPGGAPAQPGGFGGAAQPGGFGGAAGGQPGFGQPPGASGGFGGPPGGQPGFGQPAGGPPGFGQPPGASGGFGGPPGGQPGFGGPPGGQPGFGAPPGAQPGFGAPPGAQPGFGAPPGAQPGFGAPPQQPGFGAPPGAQPGFGAPPQQPGFGAPPQQPGFGAQPGYPPAQPGYGAPQGNLPGPMDDIARRLPMSAPGTVFGVPIATLRDANLQRKALFLLGVALLASIVVPLSFSPKMEFVWSFPSKFAPLIFPIVAGGAYLLVAAAPPDIRARVPPVVLQWLPFGVSFAGILISGIGGQGALASAMGGSLPGTYYLYCIGMATLIFGLLARLSNPNDQTARIIITVGAGCLLFPFFESLSPAFKFSGGAINVLHSLLYMLVLAVGVLCAAFFFPPAKLPPALQAIDALAPLFVAVFVLWLPLDALLYSLSLKAVMGMKLIETLLWFARSLLWLAAYFGVLMLTAPAAYDAIMQMVNKPPGAPPGGGGYPPQGGGGYPPPGGGYPPPGGGYPPPGGGGYPPPGGGGYPPPGGGGFPPPGGGGYPPPGGGGGQGWGGGQ